jgi:hypothetical protein
MKQLLALMTIAFLLPAGAALAQGPCQADKEKFCKDVMAAGGKPRACLKEHMDELSPACKEKLTKPKAEKEADDEKPADASADKPADSAPSSDGAATGGTGN